VQILCPAVAAVGEVLAVGNQPLVQVTGEMRDAVGAGVVAEEMAGHADLAAAAGAQHLLIEPGPVLDFFFAGRLQTGEGDRHHGDFGGRTNVLAGDGLWCHGLRCLVGTGLGRSVGWVTQSHFAVGLQGAAQIYLRVHMGLSLGVGQQDPGSEAVSLMLDRLVKITSKGEPQASLEQVIDFRLVWNHPRWPAGPWRSRKGCSDPLGQTLLRPAGGEGPLPQALHWLQLA